MILEITQLEQVERMTTNASFNQIWFQKKGFELLGEHYDVHRFHTPLIYGRRGDADVGEGISLARVKTKTNYAIILFSHS